MKKLGVLIALAATCSTLLLSCSKDVPVQNDEPLAGSRSNGYFEECRANLQSFKQQLDFQNVAIPQKRKEEIAQKAGIGAMFSTYYYNSTTDRDIYVPMIVSWYLGNYWFNEIYAFDRDYRGFRAMMEETLSSKAAVAASTNWGSDYAANAFILYQALFLLFFENPYDFTTISDQEQFEQTALILNRDYNIDVTVDEVSYAHYLHAFQARSRFFGYYNIPVARPYQGAYTYYDAIACMYDRHPSTPYYNLLFEELMPVAIGLTTSAQVTNFMTYVANFVDDEAATNPEFDRETGELVARGLAVAAYSSMFWNLFAQAINYPFELSKYSDRYTKYAQQDTFEVWPESNLMPYYVYTNSDFVTMSNTVAGPFYGRRTFTFNIAQNTVIKHREANIVITSSLASGSPATYVRIEQQW